MHKVPYESMKEQYFLKSTFFYNKLRENGYFELFIKIQKLAEIEGDNLNWSKRKEWKISNRAWEVIQTRKIDPMLLFVHPKILQINPSFLKYYRSVAMISQKGLMTLAGVSNVEKIESNKVSAGKLAQKTVDSIVNVLNDIMSLVLTFASEIDNNQIQGMMYATAGTNIDGSWRNSIGEEGERVIRSIILSELLRNNEVSSIIDKKDMTKEMKCLIPKDVLDSIGEIKTVNLTNGYFILFSSEPDVSMFDDSGVPVGVIEIKAGLDPAGALERLGAMLKSFENTLTEYPNAVTILVASCITKEVDARLRSAMTVKQVYITTEITSSESKRRKFANNMRRILKLVK